MALKDKIKQLLDRIKNIGQKKLSAPVEENIKKSDLDQMQNPSQFNMDLSWTIPKETLKNLLIEKRIGLGWNNRVMDALMNRILDNCNKQLMQESFEQGIDAVQENRRKIFEAELRGWRITPTVIQSPVKQDIEELKTTKSQYTFKPDSIIEDVSKASAYTIEHGRYSRVDYSVTRESTDFAHNSDVIINQRSFSGSKHIDGPGDGVGYGMRVLKFGENNDYDGYHIETIKRDMKDPQKYKKSVEIGSKGLESTIETTEGRMEQFSNDLRDALNQITYTHTIEQDELEQE